MILIAVLFISVCLSCWSWRIIRQDIARERAERRLAELAPLSNGRKPR